MFRGLPIQKEIGQHAKPCGMHNYARRDSPASARAASPPFTSTPLPASQPPLINFRDRIIRDPTARCHAIESYWVGIDNQSISGLAGGNCAFGGRQGSQRTRHRKRNRPPRRIEGRFEEASDLWPRVVAAHGRQNK